MLFLHWSVDPAAIQQTLPAQLRVQSFQGRAWIGVVAFRMRKVRPTWSPALPHLSFFLETNVRTYVTHPQVGPGVWFYSLDANRRLPVWIARRYWHLNYHFARLGIHQRADRIEYFSRGRSDGLSAYRFAVEQCHRGTRSAAAPLQTAATGSLDEFLIERYVLYSLDAHDQLNSGRVIHDPYGWRKTAVSVDRQELTDAAGLPPIERTPEHAVFSPGVDVTIKHLQPVSERHP